MNMVNLRNEIIDVALDAAGLFTKDYHTYYILRNSISKQVPKINKFDLLLDRRSNEDFQAFLDHVWEGPDMFDRAIDALKGIYWTYY